MIRPRALLGQPLVLDGWVVVLECVPDSAQARFELDAVQSLIEALREWQPAGMFNPNRYAVQLRLMAPAACEALNRGLAFHAQAIRTVGTLQPVVARAEVLTPDEFERAWEWPDGPRPSVPLTEALVTDKLYRATRAMVGGSTAEELAEVLVGYVRAVGGTICTGAGHDHPGMTAVDVSLGADETLHAVADGFSVTGLLIEQSLPALVADARAILDGRSHLGAAADGSLRPPT